MRHNRSIECDDQGKYDDKLQAQKELSDMEELQENNQHLIQNILPDHVAKYFLKAERRNEVN